MNIPRQGLYKVIITMIIYLWFGTVPHSLVPKKFAEDFMNISPPQLAQLTFRAPVPYVAELVQSISRLTSLCGRCIQESWN